MNLGENDPATALADLSIETQVEKLDQSENDAEGICAICLESIVLKETALIKGCEHAYCVTCILQWVTCSKKPSCPQCKTPFDFLNIHRSLDGSIQDYMFEESVCLLLRASWFMPFSMEENGDPFYEEDDLTLEAFDIYYDSDDPEDDLDDLYTSNSARFCIVNRRWGDNGYIRAGRQEAKPVCSNRSSFHDSSSSSSNEKSCVKEKTGRRAKRTLKREAADKAAAEKGHK